jgi:hypothetical protein
MRYNASLVGWLLSSSGSIVQAYNSIDLCGLFLAGTLDTNVWDLAAVFAKFAVYLSIYKGCVALTSGHDCSSQTWSEFEHHHA